MAYWEKVKRKTLVNNLAGNWGKKDEREESEKGKSCH